MIVNIVKNSKKLAKVCKAILFNKDGKILLLKRSNYKDAHSGEWDFPGGHRDDGESEQSAMKRECEEETKLVPTNLKKAFTHGSHAVFRGVIDNDKPILSHEHTDHIIEYPEKILRDGLLTKKYEEILKKALKDKNE